MVASERDVAGIGALAEPLRRRVYAYICGEPAPVSRDQTADAMGIARHQAKFHLDRLERDGLLQADYARLGGRSGPGAGRPAKLYRRADREIAVSLPDREYELAGRLMADAIAAAADGAPILAALREAAASHGAAIAADVEALRSHHNALEIAIRALADNGYEPRRDGERVVLVNCPFHALAQTHTDLVCHMNHALVGSLVDAVGPGIRADLEPGPNRCCVVLSAARGSRRDRADAGAP